MRIGIDARFFNLGSAGLARYTQELISHLAKLKTEHTFVAFLNESDKPDWRWPELEVRTTTTRWYTVREQLLFGRELERASLDLMHFTNFNFPLRYRQPFIISINDLTLLSYAGRSRLSGLKTRPMRLVMAQGAKRSLEILTYSEHQKKLIVENFGVTPGKVKVVYLAVDPQFKPLPASEITEFRSQHGLTGPFIMYTGQWRQHKNLVRLLKAFKIVRGQAAVKLVLVGKVDPAFPIIQETIRSQGLSGDVVLTDFVSDADLPRYYNAADIFAFPSLSEGFGLPPLEAMACGTTVASSSSPPMPEILGDAAVYFDPLSIGSIAETLLELLNKPGRRQRYRGLGFKQVQRYSWDRTAAETLASYEAALDRLPSAPPNLPRTPGPAT